MLEGYRRSWGIRSNLCHNQTRNRAGKKVEGKIKIEMKVAMGTVNEKHPGGSWRHVSRD